MSVVNMSGLVVVSVLELTSTSGRKSESKTSSDAGLHARKRACAEVEKACSW